MVNSLRQTSTLIISILAMLMSNYVSSMPMMDMSPISTSSAQPKLSHHVSMEMLVSTVDHNMMYSSTLVHCPEKDPVSQKHSESAMQMDCCSVSCLAGTAIMPDLLMTSVQPLQLEIFPLTTLSYTSLVNRSLYRPPIA